MGERGVSSPTIVHRVSGLGNKCTDQNGTNRSDVGLRYLRVELRGPVVFEATPGSLGATYRFCEDGGTFTVRGKVLGPCFGFTK